MTSNFSKIFSLEEKWQDELALNFLFSRKLKLQEVIDLIY